MINSIGLIESKGLVALIEAADVILKNSPVKILGIKKLENGLVSLAVQGNSDYVKAAVDAGVEAGKRVGEIYSYSVIDNPNEEFLKIFGELFAEVEINKTVESKTKSEKTDIKVQNKIEDIFPAKVVNRLESKREKSKPILTTQAVQAKIVRKSSDQKSEKIKPQKPIDGPEKNLETELNPKQDEAAENIKPASTIERLRLEALGQNTKSLTERTTKNENESEEDEINKIDLALEPKDIDFNSIEKMNVHKLRNYARKFPEFPIKGREISRANRDELVKLFKNLSK